MQARDGNDRSVRETEFGDANRQVGPAGSCTPNELQLHNSHSPLHRVAQTARPHASLNPILRTHRPRSISRGDYRCYDAVSMTSWLRHRINIRRRASSYLVDFFFSSSRASVDINSPSNHVRFPSFFSMKPRWPGTCPGESSINLQLPRDR